MPKVIIFLEKICLIIITKSFYLVQYQVAEDGRVTNAVQVKLSVSLETGSGIGGAVWAGSGLLAIATHEKFVRFLDLQSDDGYHLSMSSIDAFDKSDRVSLVSFNALDRYYIIVYNVYIIHIPYI